MPARSKAQFRFMKGVERGGIKAPGLSKSEAKEYTSGQSPKGLPDRKTKKKAAKPKNKITRAMKAAMYDGIFNYNKDKEVYDATRR